MRIRHLNHSLYQVQYHVVWGTRYRRKFLKSYVKQELMQVFLKILKNYPDWYLHKLNTGADHVHLLVEIPPKYLLTQVIRLLKSKSSHYLKKKYKFIQKIYEVGGIWSTGYFISTVGLNEENIKKYIEKQNQWEVGKNPHE